MILSKITLHGFKSFAKKVDLHFDGRITAVVGPNGCGKTNIVDAIRWGLGEQKPSVLRADRMENVIFGGAQSSRPLGMAEVSVFFDNSKLILPIDYTEVVVTRRLYRSGESEYLLNKTPIRLKDINDLFMDTGIGADAYSVIELKMVEDILSEKAEDRRRLLEEAAGVTKYKHRLKAALRKLDATRSDLLRVNDIIQEVERTVSSLKRQMQRAKRYQVLEEKIKELELGRGRQVFNQLQENIGPLRKELKSLQRQKEGRTTEITKEEAGLESLKLKMVEREKGLVQVREELNEIIERIHRREGDIRVGKERILSLRERITRYGEEIEGLKKRLDEQQSHLEVSQGEREALQVKITSTGRIFNNKKKELEVFQQGLNLKRLDLNGKKKEIIECLEGINRLSREETGLRAKIDNTQGRLERLDEEDNSFQEIQRRVREEQKKLDDALRDLRSERGKILKKRDQVFAEEEKLRTEMERAKERFYKDQSELDLMQGRFLFLKNIVESREGIADGARKLLEDKAEGLVGVFADLLEVSPEYRAAMEVGLGEAAGYLLFEEITQAYQALELLRKRGGGRAALVCLDRIKDLPERKSRPEVPRDVDFIGWGDDLVKCDRSIRSVVVHLLGDLLVVGDMDAARKVVKVFKTRGVRVATLQGELVTAWGVFQTGEVTRKDGGLVGRLERIKELEKGIRDLGKKISELQKLLREKEARCTSLMKEKERVEKNLSEIEERVGTAEKQQAKIQFEGEKAEEGILENGKERQRLLEAIKMVKDNLENLRPQMETLLEKREQIELISSQIQREVDGLEKEESVKEEEVHRLNISVVRLNGEASNLDYDIERSRGLIQDIKTTIEQRSQEIESSERGIENYEKETDQNEKALVEDFSEKEVLEKGLWEREEAFQAMQEELRVREKGVREVRKDRDEASEKIHNLEMEISELEHQAKSLKERLWEGYETDLEQVPPQDEIDLEEAEAEIEELKRKIKGLGAVNLMALREYEQEKERVDFLSQQRDDLLSAEETLKETIQKINKTAHQRFDEVFTEVRKNFQETFRRFFHGGEADLRLHEGEDPLEAQVEIVARPAGKHFRDLDLLSGGERALTAISLLFALYLVKPSPFCILDEIDAPLDDANVERFTRVLSEYSEKTQFIIVTHNKMTMQVAQLLYGVTMEEEGVSKIVSVKFEDEKEEKRS